MVTTNVSPSGRVVVGFGSFAHATYTTSAGQYVAHGSTRSIQTFVLEGNSAAHGTTLVVGRDVGLREDGLHGDDPLFRSLFTITTDARGTVTQIHSEGALRCD